MLAALKWLEFFSLLFPAKFGLIFKGVFKLQFDYQTLLLKRKAKRQAKVTEENLRKPKEDLILKK